MLRALGSRKQSVMRSKTYIYSPNKFYLTFPHDESWNFDKILNVIKKLMLTLLCKYMIFPLVLADFNYVKLFLSTVNKCIITITIIIIINVKSFLERHFYKILINSLRKWINFNENSCTAYTHSDALQRYARFTRSMYTNQENGSEMTFVSGATKIKIKNLKT